MISSCHQLSDTLINSVRYISSAPSGRMLNLKKECMEMLGSGSCLTPIYISQGVKHFNTLPECTTALFTALKLFGLKRDNSKQTL